jgi:acetyltransferase-like isoleucine patch superfamily enzyme
MGGDVSVGAGSLIGIGAIVMPQRWVGTWSTVGAGALVHRNVPDDAVVVGVPARILRHNIKLDSQVLALIQAAA